MQVAPTASGLISTQMLTIASPVSNVAAASPTGLTEAETALRVKEQQASMTAQKITETRATQVAQADPASTNTKTLQNQGTDRSSSQLNGSASIKAEKLLDYLDKAGTDVRSLSPGSFMNSGVKSFVGIVENAQNMLAGKNAVQAKEAPGSSHGTTAHDRANERSNGGQDLASLDDVLDRYVSISWASFSASLATSSVAAASTSVNTLVKQQ